MNELLLENISHEELLEKIRDFYKYAKKRLKIDRNPRIILKRDTENADDFLGKTGYYDPQEEIIALYINDRHAKDIVRSFAHELIHHVQKITGETEKMDLSDTGSDPAYSLHNKSLRKMEKQAFLWGNMIFRDWTDKQKMKRKNIMAEDKKASFIEKEKSIKQSLEKQGKSAKQASKIAPKIAGAMAAGKTYKGPGKPMKEVSYEKSGLKHPELADISKKDGKKDINPYELARGKAIEKSMKKENTMKVKLQNEKMMDEVKDEEEELTGKLGPQISRNQAETPEGTVDDEELDVDVEDEDERTGGKNPQKSAEQMAADKAGMDLATYRRYMASKKPKEKVHATEEDIAELEARIEALRAQLEASKEAERDPEIERSTEEFLSSLDESKKNPYPVLFEKRERLLNDAFKVKEERIYNELVKRFIKK